MLSSGPKVYKISGISDAIFPARHPQKSSQHVRACAAGYGAICSKNGKIVPYHGANPNTRNGARLRSPTPIMAPGNIKVKIVVALSSWMRKISMFISKIFSFRLYGLFVTGTTLSVISCISFVDSSPNLFFVSSIFFVDETWLPTKKMTFAALISI